MSALGLTGINREKETSMCHKNCVKKALFIFIFLFMGFLNQPPQARASGALIFNGGHHGGYTEVVAGSGRYYYNGGVFYTGAPGNYVAVEAPVGAVVYNVPSGYERVNVGGVVYYRYRDVYYKPEHRGYRVARIEKPRDNRDDHGRVDEKRGGSQDQHRGR